MDGKKIEPICGMRMKHVVAKQAGIALLEVTLGLVVVTIAIAVLLSTRSISERTEQEKSVAKEVTMLINHVLEFSVNCDQSCANNDSASNSGAPYILDLADSAALGSTMNISQDFLDQLSATGVTAVSVTMQWGDRNQCPDPDACHGPW